MTGWIALVVVYLAIAFGGGCMILRRGSGELDWLATRRLPHNHRITARDLKAPPSESALGVRLPAKEALEARYVVVPIADNEPVRPTNVRDAPVINARKEQSVFWLPLNEAAAEPTIDAGVFVDICTPAKPQENPMAKAEGKSADKVQAKPADQPCIRGEVVAIRCDSKSPQACAAGIWISDHHRPRLIGGDSAKRVIFIPASDR